MKKRESEKNKVDEVRDRGRSRFARNRQESSDSADSYEVGSDGSDASGHDLPRPAAKPQPKPEARAQPPRAELTASSSSDDEAEAGEGRRGASASVSGASADRRLQAGAVPATPGPVLLRSGLSRKPAFCSLLGRAPAKAAGRGRI